MSNGIKIPIKVGIQDKYDNISHDPAIIYICSDTGNMYLGDTPIGGSSDVAFYAHEQIPTEFGAVGQMCITPYGVYKKADSGEWSLFSKWNITSSGELQIDGNVPVASLNKLGFVKSSEADGDISVRSDGTMCVNGWNDIEIAQNHIFRNF